MSEKYITKDDVKVILKDVVDDIKSKMKTINKNAVDMYYSAPHPTYKRTNSFNDVVSQEPLEEYNDEYCLLTYKYSSAYVSVNPWKSPWGIEYKGDPEKAFIGAFEYGMHGGPYPTSNGWSSSSIRTTDPIIQLIEQGMENL